MIKIFSKTNISQTSNRRLRFKSGAGFTLVELLVTLGIATTLMSVTIFNYSSFNDKLALSSAAQELAVNIRQSQTYGLNVKEVTPSGGNFDSAYGIYFNPTGSASDYYIFADINADKLYDVGSGCGSGSTECTERVTLRNGIRVSSLTSTAGCSLNGVMSLHITFLRPSPNADINFANSGGSIVCATQSNGQVVLTSPKGKTLTISIENTGQISIQ